MQQTRLSDSGTPTSSCPDSVDRPLQWKRSNLSSNRFMLDEASSGKCLLGCMVSAAVPAVPKRVNRRGLRQHGASRDACRTAPAVPDRNENWLPGMDSNHRPNGKQPFTLPLSYLGTEQGPVSRGFR